MDGCPVLSRLLSLGLAFEQRLRAFRKAVMKGYPNLGGLGVSA
jgi:hypothetical protein